MVVEPLTRLDPFGIHPKGPCAQIVYTLAPKHLHRDDLKAKAYAIWIHGP